MRLLQNTTPKIDATTPDAHQASLSESTCSQENSIVEILQQNVRLLPFFPPRMTTLLGGRFLGLVWFLDR
ncbi:MAG: hypothetical protein F6J98_10710 [Moorea sp. SIO4G2]|uniref:hypothetical protein n=1 Tax=Moorena sp. SIO3E8 TaxID=2607830 RepID=UPI0013FB46C9|nr:hypothetical protein [Moorena sp. SIO3E8]NEO60880.1 hypothetical protein [Moorena sp. SIO4G2]NEQ03734.1 hypothetical protein [Moorena sp. SIO3F7]NEQ62486.1 hypothetical protein [Moorena sp. SIO4A1]